MKPDTPIQYAQNSEAPRGTCLGGADRQSRKPRGIFARLGGAFRLRGSAKRRYGATTAGEAWAEPCEAQNAIPPCGKPQGFPWPTRVVSLAELGQAGRLAKKGDDIEIKCFWFGRVGCC
ncbi:MAG: hypothetical protein Q7J98_12160 [Kiritimatiellia bacterium]|nr:hypothetical protein [Kiritimatiellia bacterium]